LNSLIAREIFVSTKKLGIEFLDLPQGTSAFMSPSAVPGRQCFTMAPSYRFQPQPFPASKDPSGANRGTAGSQRGPRSRAHTGRGRADDVDCLRAPHRSAYAGATPPDQRNARKPNLMGRKSPERALRRSHAVLSSTRYNFRFLPRGLAGVSNTRFEPRSRSSRKTK
jgi:hypothetical protein